MSFLSDTDVNKRVRNLFTSDATPAPLVPMAFTITATGAQVFLANYAADFPGLVPLGGSWDAVTVPANGTVVGDVLTLTGTGCGIGDTGVGFPTPDAVSFEVVLTDPIVSTPAVGWCAIVSPNVDQAPPPGGNPGAIMYDALGDIYDANATLAASVTPWAPGDVIGVVLVPDGGTGTIFTQFYLNGVAIGPFMDNFTSAVGVPITGIQ